MLLPPHLPFIIGICWGFHLEGNTHCREPILAVYPEKGNILMRSAFVALFKNHYIAGPIDFSSI